MNLIYWIQLVSYLTLLYNVEKAPELERVKYLKFLNLTD